MVETLVVYFSYSGHTRRVAETIADALGADIAEIRPEQPYDGTYDEVVDQGKREVDGKVCPPIKALECHFEDYKTIVLGTPVWWYTYAPAVGTFLDEYNFTNMTVYPFDTNGGQPGHTLADINDALPDAEVMGGLEILFDGDTMKIADGVIDDWCREIQDRALENTTL